MLCDICKKNEATVHLTEIIDEQMNELHLCEECARQKSIAMEQQFGLSDLLAGMTDFDKLEKEAEPVTGLKCPNCGLTYADFKKIGRLGCGNCYSTFSKYLGPLLKRIHGSTQHSGKYPFKITRDLKKKVDTQELRIRLQKAIESEAFEEAAKLRDQIKGIENKKEK
ncbi:MAG: UvrB/UvrC motif-containing protein [Candidatus Omnitrophica bacterium]|nr:UvrB/UvrC motif-containing protein [Candidatus Omnitrophota bacterium]MDD5027167.1 UvrB/UvrC motif-containing protein [Candidatus Omnitrophota bacterium]MDD5662194.1 UvrB/UvrC motif-containing protein [Candidatus Omnitrophota bacterium]